MSEIYWGHWRGMDAISRIAGTVMCMKKWCTTTVVALTPSNALDDCTTISSIPHPAMVRGTKPGESLQHARKPRSVCVPAMSSDARSPIGDVSEILDAMAWHCDGFLFKISRTRALLITVSASAMPNDDIRDILDAMAWKCDGWKSRDNPSSRLPHLTCTTTGKYICKRRIAWPSAPPQCYCACHYDAHE